MGTAVLCGASRGWCAAGCVGEHYLSALERIRGIGLTLKLKLEEHFLEAYLDIPNSPSDLLLPFEQMAMMEHYRPYYEIKRNNFLASIQGAPDLWHYFQLLDKIFLTEFEDMGTAHDPNRMFPLALYFNAHAKIRISMELAFTRCMEEARSILRDAIETAVFAHYMHDDPNLQKIWLGKDDNPQAGKDFSLAFEKDKKTKLFKGLPELHEKWGRLS
jgi:hypothetical protein